MLVTIYKHSIEIISFFLKFFLLTTGPLRPLLICLRSGSGPMGPMSPLGPGRPLSPGSPFFPGSPGCPGKRTYWSRKTVFFLTAFRDLCRVNKILLVFFRKRVSTPPRLNRQHYQGLLELLVAQADQVDMGCQNLFLPSPETVYHCCSPNQTPTNKHRDWE